MMKDRIEIHEVGPRDRLQNVKRMIPAADKIRVIDAGIEALADIRETAEVRDGIAAFFGRHPPRWQTSG